MYLEDFSTQTLQENHVYKMLTWHYKKIVND